jgi:hypothetical protein
MSITVAMALLLPLASQARDAEKAMIVTSGERPMQCISPVQVHEIDGAEARVNRAAFEIEPGRHSLNGRATLNLSFCRALQGNETLGAEILEAEFEAGKTYHVGYDHSASHPEDWKLVIWKTEDG